VDIPVSDDSLALEGDEAFLVGLEISGITLTTDGFIIDGGRGKVTTGLREARVVIIDDTGESLVLDRCDMLEDVVRPTLPGHVWLF